MGFRPVCDYCGNAIIDIPDMHEHFLTRGDLQGSPNRRMIYVAQNCVLVHPGGNSSFCHVGAASTSGQVLITKRLIIWVGYGEIYNWLTSMKEYVKSNQAVEAIRLLQEVYQNGA